MTMATLSRVLRAALVVAFVTTVLGAVLPGWAGTAAAVIGLAVLICAPVARVAWLTLAWAREGDRRFAGLGAVLLLILVAGGLTALA